MYRNIRFFTFTSLRGGNGPDLKRVHRRGNFVNISVRSRRFRLRTFQIILRGTWFERNTATATHPGSKARILLVEFAGSALQGPRVLRRETSRPEATTPL